MSLHLDGYYVVETPDVTDDDLAKRLENLSLDNPGDFEEIHTQADKLLSSTLRELGYTKSADIYDSLDKWYG